MSDLIRRQDAIEYFMTNTNWHDEDGYTIENANEKRALLTDYFNGVPSAEPLTDVEQRIFLKAISREEEVCRKIDVEWGKGDEECEINLVHVCHEIVRKVKGALWI